MDHRIRGEMILGKRSEFISSEYFRGTLSDFGFCDDLRLGTRILTCATQNEQRIIGGNVRNVIMILLQTFWSVMNGQFLESSSSKLLNRSSK